ncbi:FecR domain-containing protein [Reyranella sp.]|uniref:FecR family protein n=1 Tax=Reyranella sp. TaxID=1929291 RepID=UPI0025CEFED1|nr:FecR domain-containing protein [Reyranella sp.]
MKARSDIPSRAIEEAAEWSVLLMDEPGDLDLRRRFEAWRRRSTENAAAWVDIQQTIDLADEALPDHAHEWRAMAAPRRQRRAKAGRRRWLMPAAVVALAAVIGWSVLPGALLRLQADHVTATAELRTIGLLDGSTVTLGPDSAISVTFSPRERQVRLIKGEAFFEVAADRNRPFKVATPWAQASVLGTRFEVCLDDAGTKVAVEEGHVLVEGTHGRETLDPGQAIEVATTGTLQRVNLEAGSVAMWRQRLVYLKNRPMAEAVNEIRRYFPGRIVVTDDALAEQPTTGVFNLNDPEAALRGLAQAHGARVRRISPWLLVVSGS